MKRVTKALILIMVGLAALIPFASTYPDGLEKVAESLGLEEHEPIWGGLMPDYNFGLAGNPYIAKLVSGLIGLFLVFSAAWGIGRMFTRSDEG